MSEKKDDGSWDGLLHKEFHQLTQEERRRFDVGGILNAYGNFELIKGQYERSQRRKERGLSW